MQYLITLLVLLLLLPTFAWGACASSCTHSGTTWTCSDISRECVQEALESADNGETVVLAAGTATWAVTADNTSAHFYCNDSASHDWAICTGKGVHIKGAGAASTVITINHSVADAIKPGILFMPSSAERTANVTFEVSGIGFIGAGTYVDHLAFVYIGNATYVDPYQVLSNIKIHDNSFTTGYSATYTAGPVYGVSYKNTLVDVGNAIKNEGGDVKAWRQGHLSYGTANAFYFEDNTISCTTAMEVGATAGQGGSIVLRYNTYDLGTCANQYVYDLHGTQTASDSAETCNGGCGGGTEETCYSMIGETRCCPLGSWSQIKSEFYGNLYANVDVSNEFVNWRGSKALMFFNSSAGDGTASILHYSSLACEECAADPATYSTRHQDGYFFLNLMNGTNQPMSIRGAHADKCADDAGAYARTITAGTDFWNYVAYASFDGTTGVTCGTLANLQGAEYYTSCTAGVGYWATAQSCSDLTGMVGASPSTPISGTLYKCNSTGNGWDSYYTPYTYPHPLRGTGHSFSGGATHSFGSGSTITWQ